MSLASAAPTGGPRGTAPSDTFGHSGHRRASNTGHTGHMSSDILRTLGHMSSDTPDICPRTRPDTSGHTGHSGQPGKTQTDQASGSKSARRLERELTRLLECVRIDGISHD